MLDCQTCPLPSSLTTVPAGKNCEVFGKDAKWIFQRRDDANNAFTAGGISVEANWTSLPDASNNTKVVVTPLLEEVERPEPDILEDSENYDGAPIAVSTGPQKWSAVMRNPTAAQVSALRDLSCESDITFYRVDDNGNFGARAIGSDHAGILVSPDTFVIKGPYRGPNRVDMDKVKIEFFTANTWYDTFDQVAPAANFDPLTEIVPS